LRMFSWTSQDGLVSVGTLGGTRSYPGTGLPMVTAAGETVGASFVSGDELFHAFAWTPHSGLTDLGTLGGSLSEASAVNNRGLVVGESSTAAGKFDAFAWTPGTGMVDLGSLGASSYARSVSNSGLIVGTSYLTPTGSEAHAVLWTW